MSKKKDPLGGANGKYDTFVNGLYNQVNDNHAAWVIDVLIIGVILGLLTEWNKKWGVSKNKTTATTADRKATKTARKNLTDYLRPFIQVSIYRNTNMSDEDIVACGLNPHDRTKTPVGKPDSEPELEFKVIATHVLGVYYHQSAGEDGVSKRAKPDGVGFCKIAYFIGDNAPLDPNDFPKVKLATRTPVKLSFNPAESGKKITIAACWVSTSNIDGDWNEPEDTKIP